MERRYIIINSKGEVLTPRILTLPQAAEYVRENGDDDTIGFILYCTSVDIQGGQLETEWAPEIWPLRDKGDR